VQLVQVTVPPGVVAGQSFPINVSGCIMQVRVPEGVLPGENIQVGVPSGIGRVSAHPTDLLMQLSFGNYNITVSDQHGRPRYEVSGGGIMSNNVELSIIETQSRQKVCHIVISEGVFFSRGRPVAEITSTDGQILTARRASRFGGDLELEVRNSPTGISSLQMIIAGRNVTVKQAGVDQNLMTMTQSFSLQDGYVINIAAGQDVPVSVGLAVLAHHFGRKR
jgi:hypothetical protein